MALSTLCLVAAFGLASGHGLGSPCWPDMKRLCPEEVKQKPPMPFFKTDCFTKNKDKLSPACQAMYEFHLVRHEVKNVVDGCFKGVHNAITEKAPVPPMPAFPVVGWANIAVMPADHMPMDAINSAGGEMGKVEVKGEGQGWMKHMHGHHHGNGGHGKGPFREHMRKFCGADSDRLCGTEGPRCQKWKCLSANIDKVSEECKSVLAAARAWHMRFHANDHVMEHMRMMHQQGEEAPAADGVDAKSEDAEPEVPPQDFLQCYMMVAALLMALSITLTLLVSSARAKTNTPSDAPPAYVPVPTSESDIDADEKPLNPIKA
eukprot:comp23925_c0_seq1/m.42235 comp23925_c0_seq1/g.42235  ORF comp23925_c0_seq1/g.42235 comp23925_c0_seq1/m.42235 type:complete len:318 (-) comp23925_c0_seq1:485-1438(-)